MRGVVVGLGVCKLLILNLASGFTGLLLTVIDARAPEDRFPRPGAIESHKAAGNEALSDSPPALFQAIPRPT